MNGTSVGMAFLLLFTLPACRTVPVETPACISARDHLDAAKRLRNIGNIAGACRELEMARELEKTDTITYHLASCYAQLGEAQQAKQLFEEYIHAAEQKVNKSQAKLEQLASNSNQPERIFGTRQGESVHSESNQAPASEAVLGPRDGVSPPTRAGVSPMNSDPNKPATRDPSMFMTWDGAVLLGVVGIVAGTFGVAIGAAQGPSAKSQLPVPPVKQGGVVLKWSY